MITYNYMELTGVTSFDFFFSVVAFFALSGWAIGIIFKTVYMAFR